MPVTLPAAAREALDLLFPTWCAGCDAPGAVLCDACVATLEHTAGRVWRRTPDGLGVVSAWEFDGVPARLLRGLKEESRLRLARSLGGGFRGAIQAACRAWAEAADIAVVPIPVSRASWRRRGFSCVEVLCRRADHTPYRALGPGRVVRDQRELGRHERGTNIAGAFRVTRNVPARILLIDDVVTTGATLDEAARILVEGGATVVGAATVATTPRRAAMSLMANESQWTRDRGASDG